jgi:hypothetical protein
LGESRLTKKTSQTRCVSHVFQTDASNAWDVSNHLKEWSQGAMPPILGLKCWKKDEQRAQLEGWFRFQCQL